MYAVLALLIMQLRIIENDDFITLSKPYNIRTRQVSDGQFGFVDFLTEKLAKSLFVVHDLDNGTSGLILFAKSKESAAKISELFEKQQIKKTYYFLTDKAFNTPNLDGIMNVTSHIDKQNNTFFNNPAKEPNSETDFKFIKPLGKYFLWSAQTKTCKSHQIRLHAEKAKIAILGDSEHGGTRYFRLALHSQRLEFNFSGVAHVFESELPPLLSQEFTCEIEALFTENCAKRNQLYDILPGESYRLLHIESDDVRADILNDHLWVYDYSKHGLSDANKKVIAEFALSKNLKLIIRHMINRGQGVGGLENTTLEISTRETEWLATEENIKYKLKIDSGFSSGLFLDQRENRKWVRQNSLNKNVLNLFSYTADFSINAALGGAREVTTVDVSPKFLDWSKENFLLNHLDPAKYEFFAQDCTIFLKGVIKLDRKWDLIICDPPSVGRSKDSIWKLENDLPMLAKNMVDCLNPGGQILFTCNLEKHSRSEIMDLFLKNLKKAKLQKSRLPMLSLDYELTDDLNNLMKGFLITKE